MLVFQLVFQAETDSLSTETGMSFEAVALFPGSSLIKSKTSFLQTVSKETFSLPKFFLSFHSFIHFQNLYFQLIHADLSFW